MFNSSIIYHPSEYRWKPLFHSRLSALNYLIDYLNIKRGKETLWWIKCIQRTGKLSTTWNSGRVCTTIISSLLHID